MLPGAEDLPCIGCQFGQDLLLLKMFTVCFISEMRSLFFMERAPRMYVFLRKWYVRSMYLNCMYVCTFQSCVLGWRHGVLVAVYLPNKFGGSAERRCPKLAWNLFVLHAQQDLVVDCDVNTYCVLTVSFASDSCS